MGWVGFGAGLDGCGKSRRPNGIRFPDEIDVGENIIEDNIMHLGRFPYIVVT
jgi:hypothetical protein